MSIELRDDLHAFRAFIDEQLGDGDSPLTPAEALDIWETRNPTAIDRAETSAAIRQGLKDVAEGRIRPIEEFDREFRQKHGLPPRA
jgi:predicted transcriptional regulator